MDCEDLMTVGVLAIIGGVATLFRDVLPSFAYWGIIFIVVTLIINYMWVMLRG